MSVINPVKVTKVQKAFDDYARMHMEVKILQAKIDAIKDSPEYVKAKAEIIACCKCNEGKLSHNGLTAKLQQRKEYFVKAYEFVLISGLPKASPNSSIDKETDNLLNLLYALLAPQEDECLA